MGTSTTKPIEVSVRIVKAFVSRNGVAPDDVPDLLRAVYASLRALHQPMKPAEAVQPPVPIDKTVTRNFIVSLEDGKPYISLKHHLRARGLTPELYRKKWGLSPHYPMVAKSYSERRSAAAIAQGLGRKAQTVAEETPAEAEA